MKCPCHQPLWESSNRAVVSMQGTGHGLQVVITLVQSWNLETSAFDTSSARIELAAAAMTSTSNKRT